MTAWSLRPRPLSGSALPYLAAGGLALAMGAFAAAGDGMVVATALVGLIVVGAAVALYRKDPVLALIWFWFVALFNAPVSAAVGYSTSRGEAIRQGDEILVVLFVLLTLGRLLRSTERLPSVRYVVVAVGVACFGVVGAIMHGVPLRVTAVGAWLGLKLWIMVAITLVLPWTEDDAKRIYSVITKVGVPVAVLGFVDYATHGDVSRSLHTAVSYGTLNGYRANAVQSVLATPGEYSLFMSLLFALTVSRLTASRSWDDLALVLLFAASAILSLRLKGVLSLAAVLLIVVAAQTAYNPRIAASVLLIGIILVLAVYSVEKSVITKQVSTYSSLETTPRAKLYSTSELIAKKDFPFGVGFGRFASYPSRLYYSPVYQEYGLNVVFGLSPSYPKFIDDTSWPSVIGETGYGGFAIYLIGLLMLLGAIVRALQRASSTKKWLPLAALCAFSVLLVDSLGDPTLFDWAATTTFALILGPALVVARSERAIRR
jgi:hypothetical protein